MPHALSMGNNPGFFNERKTAHSDRHASNSRVFIDVGGNGDCGFRAIAVSMMDNVFTNPRVNQELAKTLLALHTHYYGFKSAGRLLTAVEQLKERTKTPASRAQFIHELSYALRQVAVDELCAHPATYRSAFVTEHEGTSPATMRLATTWIDESAIAALAKVMNVSVSVQVIEKGKELPLILHYNTTIKTPSGSPVAIQLQGNHYCAAVNKQNKAFFSPLRTIKTELPTPQLDVAKNDPESAAIFAEVERVDKALLEEFTQTKKRLHAMVSAGELSKDQLISIYIKGMNRSDYLQGRIQYGHQAFFAAIEKARAGHNEEALAFPKENHDELVIQELCHALARAVSIGQMDPLFVYETQESKRPPGNRP
ncbi:MAG: OTU domain-containing protein [Tatlockia sp.]|jgi:hypothetical protein